MTKTTRLLLGGLFLVALGCRKEPESAPGTGDSASSAAEPSASVAGAPVSSGAAPASLGRGRLVEGSSVPLPPRFVVLPGKGLAAIRFGATQATVERHVGAPCELRSETRCAYVDRALDFTFEGGVLVKIRVERRGRVVPGAPGRFFGTFNGAMAPKIMLGLHRHIVAEEWPQKPERVEPLSGPDGQVERQSFPGLALEFDQLDNGNTVLAAFEITKNEAPK